MDINCNALRKLLADFCYLSLPALGVESLKPYCCRSMKSFYLFIYWKYFSWVLFSFPQKMFDLCTLWVEQNSRSSTTRQEDLFFKFTSPKIWFRWVIFFVFLPSSTPVFCTSTNLEVIFSWRRVQYSFSFSSFFHFFSFFSPLSFFLLMGGQWTGKFKTNKYLPLTWRYWQRRRITATF